MDKERSIDEYDIDILTEEIEELCRIRNELLLGFGIEEPYLVIDNSIGKINQQTWVLDPERELDLEVLTEMQGNLTSMEQRENLKRWLKEYKEYRCVRNKCSEVNSPVCCHYCECKEYCGLKHERCEGCDYERSERC